jgi:hypothetical protein
VNIVTTPQRGDFSPSLAEKKVLINAIFDGRNFVMSDGQPVDMIQPGTGVQIRFSAVDLNERAGDLHLLKEETRLLFPAGTTLYARVDLRGIQDEILNFRIDRHDLYEFESAATNLARRFQYFDAQTRKTNDGLVEVRLHEPLTMSRIGQKTFTLDSCACEVFGIGRNPIEVLSLNQALSRISEYAEIHRASHTGNVFFRFLAPLNDQRYFDLRGRLGRLEVLRDESEFCTEAEWNQFMERLLKPKEGM